MPPKHLDGVGNHMQERQYFIKVNKLVFRKNIYRQLCGVGLLLAGLLSTGCEQHSKKSPLTVKYYYTQTEDGITLALRRYRQESLSAEKNPVILCHGFSYNLLLWDLKEDVSLPRYLAKEGYDVWSLSLRGSCPSSQPFSSAIRRLGHFHLDPEMIKTLRQ